MMHFQTRTVKMQMQMQMPSERQNVVRKQRWIYISSYIHDNFKEKMLKETNSNTL